jgi:hypothetical protein
MENEDSKWEDAQRSVFAARRSRVLEEHARKNPLWKHTRRQRSYSMLQAVVMSAVWALVMLTLFKGISHARVGPEQYAQMMSGISEGEGAPVVRSFIADMGPVSGAISSWINEVTQEDSVAMTTLDELRSVTFAQ